jgi:hypothetical protein
MLALGPVLPSPEAIPFNGFERVMMKENKKNRIPKG